MAESSVLRMERIAQTNLQLYCQLLDQHWEGPALGLVADAYELALRLFAVRVRPNRKPFICHLVATASVTSSECDRAEATAASLLHAAYTLGDWGDGKRGPTPRRRALVERATGVATERLVARYTAMPWGYHATAGVLSRAADLDDDERTVVLMRLANEVDEWADGGLRFSDKGDYPRFGAENATAVRELARSLGYVRVAELLDEAFRRHEALSVPRALRIEGTDPEGGRVTPQSRLLRMGVRMETERDAGQALRRGARKLADAVRRRRIAAAPALDSSSTEVRHGD